ncbi:MAG: hypothetical protein HY289_07395 [Planctomycetes bacterium]|nr:hypothetical protein [Planctomycetota bacterium]
MIYAAPPVDEPITQADIIDGCPLFGIEAKGTANDLITPPARWVERVIVLTQACDLAQAKATKVAVAIVHAAQDLVDRGIMKGTIIRDQVRRGLVYGWYFLPAAPGSIAIQESLIDLRDLHTVPRAVLERLIADGKRVGRFLSPYREHLAQHFAITYMRIGLPAPFESES